MTTLPRIMSPNCSNSRILAFTIAMCAVPFAHAQGQPLACQMVENGGFSWRNGAWTQARFEEKRFILVQTGETLGHGSVAKALAGLNVQCRISLGRTHCMDDGGGFLIYDPRTRQGTWLQGLGGTIEATQRRDSLHVAPFICEPF